MSGIVLKRRTKCFVCGSTNHPNSHATRFLEMVQEERARQDRQWGTQSHPLAMWLAILTEEFGEFAKEVVELECGRVPDRTLAIKELVETAAVAQAIYEQYFGKELDDEDGRDLHGIEEGSSSS